MLISCYSQKNPTCRQMEKRDLLTLGVHNFNTDWATAFILVWKQPKWNTHLEKIQLLFSVNIPHFYTRMKDLHYGKTPVIVISCAQRIFVIPLWCYLSVSSHWHSNGKSDHGRSDRMLSRDVMQMENSSFSLVYEVFIDWQGVIEKNYLGDSRRFCQIYLVRILISTGF